MYISTPFYRSHGVACRHNSISTFAYHQCTQNNLKMFKFDILASRDQPPTSSIVTTRSPLFYVFAPPPEHSGHRNCIFRGRFIGTLAPTHLAQLRPDFHLKSTPRCLLLFYTRLFWSHPFSRCFPPHQRSQNDTNVSPRTPTALKFDI